MEIKENNSNKKGMKILIAILIIIILGMGVYICYDKGIIFSTSEKGEKKSAKDDEKLKDENEADSDVNQIRPLDLSKCLNTQGYNYNNAKDTPEASGLSMQINSDQTTITLSIDWAIFGPLSNASAFAPVVKTYQITGFSKKVSSTFVGVLGQDAMGLTLFYLMSDGTVEYTPMFVRSAESYNMNYSYDYSADGRIINDYFSTKGMLNNVKDVIKLYTVDASVPNGGGGVTTIGAKKDGSFYDLGHIINGN